ncbi:MAG TPA: leucine-rich repeat protein, partial [Prolixibacteraceae bacterium]|nr:leucine-rich repeat protein [Prolixibacteraceae bacterium]
NVDKTNCILYVPYGSKELYAASQWWKDFQNIVEMAEFKIMTSKATMKATRDIVRMRIQSQVAWTAEPSEEWLTVNPASGNDDQAITITAEANPTDILRTGTVTFRATGYLPQIFTLTQEGLPKPVNLTAGNLASLFTPEELKQITSLVITGTMDARDFKVIRDQMPWLGYLDLTGVTITAYSGNEGTYYGDYNYPANAIPPYALHTDNQSIPSRLSEILLPSSLALIDNQAFGSSVLTSLIIPPSVTSIGKGAFSYSMRLKEMTIPPSVTALEESLFTGCTGLTAVTLPSSLISIGNYAFQDCDSLKEMLIPSSVESIGEGAFFGCKSLSSVALPSSITTLRESLFQDCFSLTSITIPASVTSVGRFVFFNCSRLDSITLPSSLTLLDEGIFVGCTNLKTFIVPPMVTTIGSREFVNCTNLVSVSIPESVSAIGTVAFEGCINLTSIYVFRADPPQLDGLYKVFNEVNYSNCTLYVPYGSRLNYATAKEWKDFKNIVEMAENQLWPIDANALTTGADVKKTDVEMKCYPNPFTDQMTIDIANPSHRAVSVEIYSISGQKISTLLRAQKGANINCTWNGKDEQGKQVPAGMFLLKVNEETRKVMKE